MRNRHRQAVEQASPRWRGGHDPAVAEPHRENSIYAQVLDYVITGALPEPRDGPGFKTMMERQGAGNPNPGG